MLPPFISGTYHHSAICISLKGLPSESIADSKQFRLGRDMWSVRTGGPDTVPHWPRAQNMFFLLHEKWQKMAFHSPTCVDGIMLRIR